MEQFQQKEEVKRVADKTARLCQLVVEHQVEAAAHLDELLQEGTIQRNAKFREMVEHARKDVAIANVYTCRWLFPGDTLDDLPLDAA